MLLSDTTLSHSVGKTSFEDMRSVGNVLHESYKETCRSLGPLKHGELWYLEMEDARQQNLPVANENIVCHIIDLQRRE